MAPAGLHATSDSRGSGLLPPPGTSRRTGQREVAGIDVLQTQRRNERTQTCEAEGNPANSSLTSVVGQNCYDTILSLPSLELSLSLDAEDNSKAGEDTGRHLLDVCLSRTCQPSGVESMGPQSTSPVPAQGTPCPSKCMANRLSVPFVRSEPSFPSGQGRSVSSRELAIRENTDTLTVSVLRSRTDAPCPWVSA